MTRETLDTIGLRRGVPQASDDRDYLTTYEAAVGRMRAPLTDVVVVARGYAIALGNTFAERYPDSTVHVLAGEWKPPEGVEDQDPLSNVHVHHWQRTDDLVAVLSTQPRPQLLVLALHRKTEAKVAALRKVHGFVQAEGVLAVENIDRAPTDVSTSPAGDSLRSVIEEAARRAPEPPPKHGWSTWLDAFAQSIGDVTYHGQLALVSKRETLGRTLRGEETVEVLAARYGEASPVTVLESQPGFPFEGCARVASHGRGPELASGPFTIPTLELRHYSRALVYPRQLVAYDEYWLPDTFRHQHATRLRHRGILKSGDHLAMVRPDWRPARRRRWDGPLYYLDTEFPGHFGHVSTEVVSRMWGWERARQEFPEIRPLISLRPGTSTVPTFMREIFDAYGIPSSRLVVQQGDEMLEVADIVGADPEFENPRFVSPAIVQTWERIRDAFASVEPPVRAERIFVTRTARRLCQQAPEIERFFADRGFAIVRPEDYSYGEQVQLFAQARIIAGYGGSGMFTMMHAPHARVILISGDGYSAKNEALIGAVNGNEVHYFWGRTQRSDPDPSRRRVAFGDDFTFNLRRHRWALRRLLN
ncbi:glycosyltransferase family 61 protein [Mumia sp. zg.B17]|uniref:glycosyltransferase family 61 protein n=1 Tax=Mumia sp. zg.B17 TaxID=2855446 RepID=UPI001C6E8F46|nr:glycosyltransferase family 61 protein [Mumia sp. zg.B17]MBW9204490.1 glycosyltransferase family 61 protein [Mumia sp. zg.B17]